jgi:membrane protein implicated in regulation of membrane protease activity
MVVIAIAWIYVVLMMAAAEATGSGGSLLGAFFIVLGYGVLPLSIALYLLGTPARRARQRAAEAAAGPGSVSALDPDRGDHATGDAVAPVREEP